MPESHRITPTPAQEWLPGFSTSRMPPGDPVCCDTEIWGRVPDWPAYEVSTAGRVKSFWKRLRRPGGGTMFEIGSLGHILAPGRSKKTGHLSVVLCDGHGKHRTFPLQNLVLLVHVGPCPPGKEACHAPDPDPGNCRLDNLRWDTHQSNCVDRVIHGNQRTAKLRPEDIHEIRRLLIGGLHQTEIAKRFGVSAKAISSIKTNKAWTHVAGWEGIVYPVYPVYPVRPAKPKAIPRPRRPKADRDYERRERNRLRGLVPPNPSNRDEFIARAAIILSLCTAGEVAFLVAVFAETWADIPDSEGYQVSSWGRMRGEWRRGHRTDLRGANSRPRGQWHPKKVTTVENGYLKVGIKTKGKPKTRFVHHLVLEAFVGPRPKGLHARHVIVNDPGNACLWNLAWGLPKENSDDRKRHRSSNVGSRHPMAKLTESEVRQIRYKRTHGYSIFDLAKEYGIEDQTVRQICSRKTWNHVQ